MERSIVQGLQGVMTIEGFAEGVNGVVRSGYYIYSSYKCCRCGYRTQLNKDWSSTAVLVGFRCVNGVFRGGNWYQRPSYTRIVIRSGSEKRSYVLNSIGFRSEWCNA